ncbi:RDD family protein [Nocardioides sp. KIGAM211]|uniref:RDD family protein n=1 Tax=Nocardioides luti TaxID=2761101 RepID=A0A7X0VBQ7_9ACTN|nr:RDD family protein [Nocardioides luti]MBB6628680.1 RDD family protein [Nocardioides luti]
MSEYPSPEAPTFPAAELDRRFYAFTLDRLLAWSLDLIAALAAYHFLIDRDQVWAGVAVIVAAVLLVGLAFSVLLGQYGLSPGKAAVGLRVVHHGTGTPIGIGPAMLRSLILGVSALPTFGLGVATLAWTAVMDRAGQRRGWHDQVSHTIVVDVRPAPVEEEQVASAPRHIVNLTAMRLVPAPVAAPVSTPARSPRPAPSAPRPSGPPAAAGAPLAGATSATPEQPAPAAPAAAAPAAPWSPPPAGAPTTPPPTVAPASTPAAPAAAPAAAAAPAPAAEESAAAPRQQLGPPLVSPPATPRQNLGPPLVSPPSTPAPGRHAGQGPSTAERTVIRSGGPAMARWRVDFDSGESFLVEGLALVGRRPEARQGEPVRHLVPLRSTDMSLSKTHAQFQVASDGVLVVMDRGSTNGSILIRQGVTRELVGGKPATLLDGDQIRFGDRTMTVTREG